MEAGDDPRQPLRCCLYLDAVMDKLPKSECDRIPLWAWINIALILAAVVWVALSHRPMTEEVSGPFAAFIGLLLLSLAGEFAHSGKFFLRTGAEVTVKNRPMGFWTIVVLLVVAGIRSLLLY